MLYYDNPKFKHFHYDDYFNVLKFREEDWNQLIPNIKEFFMTVAKHTKNIEFKNFEVENILHTSREIIEDTLLDKKVTITLYNNKKDIDHHFIFIVPYMDKQHKLTINGNKRFLVFQLTDLTVTRRKTLIRINSNIRSIIININRFYKNQDIGDKPNYYVEMGGTQIPLICILMARLNLKELEKLTGIKITFNQVTQDNHTLSEAFKLEIPENTPPEYIWLFEDLNKELILHESFPKRENKLKDYFRKHCQKGLKINIVDILDDVEKLDIYLKRYLISDSIEEDILLMLRMPQHIIHINDLKFKRVRIHEYILGYIMNQVFNQLYKFLPSMKQASRNYSISNLLTSKFQQMVRLSKTEDNLVAELAELLKVTSVGPGGIPLESVTTNDRNIHESYYGILDPIVTPDGEKCGIVNYITLTCPINKDGTFDFNKIIK